MSDEKVETIPVDRPQVSELSGVNFSNEVIEYVNPQDCVSLINPRQEDEYDIETLLPEILRTRGQVTKPSRMWDVNPEDHFRKAFDLVNGKLVHIEGNRRGRCLRYILANPEDFEADILQNALKFPIIRTKGITEEQARELAMDDRGKKPLLSYEVAMEIARRLKLDHSYPSIVADIGQDMYSAFLNNGHSLYLATESIKEYDERQKERETKLRNWGDHLVANGVKFGPAMENQVILTLKKKKDNRPLKDEERRLFKADLQVITALNTLFNKCKKAKQDWTKITALSYENGKVTISGGFSVKEGTKSDFNKKLDDLIVAFHTGGGTQNPKPTYPTVSEREAIADTVRSDYGKSQMDFGLGKPSEDRARLEEATYRMEQVAKILTAALPQMDAAKRKLAEAVVSEEDLEKVKAIWTKKAPIPQQQQGGKKGK